jgi:hypothetical protein
VTLEYWKIQYALPFRGAGNIGRCHVGESYEKSMRKEEVTKARARTVKEYGNIFEKG